jgi:hypothetical protein
MEANVKMPMKQLCQKEKLEPRDAFSLFLAQTCSSGSTCRVDFSSKEGPQKGVRRQYGGAGASSVLLALA